MKKIIMLCLLAVMGFGVADAVAQKKGTKENKAVQKQMEVLMLNEDFLTENLSGESKKKFLDFVNAWGVVNGESNLDSFIMGFRLGANFTYDTFVNDDAPFKDLLKE